MKLHLILLTLLMAFQSAFGQADRDIVVYNKGTVAISVSVADLGIATIWGDREVEVWGWYTIRPGKYVRVVSNHRSGTISGWTLAIGKADSEGYFGLIPFKNDENRSFDLYVKQGAFNLEYDMNAGDPKYPNTYRIPFQYYIDDHFIPDNERDEETTIIVRPNASTPIIHYFNKPSEQNNKPAEVQGVFHFEKKFTPNPDYGKYVDNFTTPDNSAEVLNVNSCYLNTRRRVHSTGRCPKYRYVVDIEKLQKAGSIKVIEIKEPIFSNLPSTRFLHLAHSMVKDIKPGRYVIHLCEPSVKSPYIQLYADVISGSL